MADSFKEALLKAGKVSQSDIDRREQAEKDKAQKILDDKKAADKIEYDRIDKERKDFEDSQKPFYDMWKGEKSKKFLTHLIFSFTPFSMGQYAWTNEELKSKNCCICKHKLMSKETLWSKRDKLVEAGIDHIKRLLHDNSSEKYVKALNKIIDGGTMGIVSPYSDTAFCTTCFSSFGDWVSNELVKGNREINGIIRKRMREIAAENEAKKEPINATVPNNRQDLGNPVSGEVPGSETEGEGRGASKLQEGEKEQTGEIPQV